ncbi:alpha/beta hydrolase [Burkholderia glumae]|uniref:alpha/beta hydrolase family protein n=1 Tax=Burkholderia glumae TaxID=337 RepID=UPI000C27D10A|nr:alpha/beta hydrolase [Burkholderia glumae]MCM2492599.1 alpha/beta hydrolase [Burkholderia glumae]MCM2543596.1 alpha/beta hydrolase [Burkholderia glumae]MCQ0032401.1 alpha/beta hydrolase [Burkholderia glumae]MCQ0035312.1 alpha/beta hydrolase [Burkholderia glumae]PJO22236.1 alpha/beta hydrolase [Burkholderia glumae AU6208]
MATTVETLQFAARDGRPLMGSLYIPVRSNGRAVLLSGALGMPRARYDGYARFLAEAGFTVLSFDYRGTGGSRAPGGRPERATLRHWGEADLPAALDCLVSRTPGARYFAVGHGEGGRLLGGAPNLARLEGIVTIAAGTGHWADARGAARLVLALLAYGVLPLAGRVVARVPWRLVGADGAEVPASIALDWARGCRDAAAGIAAAGRAGFAAYRGPLLAYAIDDDPFSPRTAVAALHRRFTGARVELREIAPHAGQQPIGRDGYFRDDNRALWPSALAWLASA